MVYRRGIHDLDSHRVFYGKQMTPAQRKYVRAAAKSNPNTLPSTVRRGSYTLHDEAMRIGPQHSRAVANLVRTCRHEFEADKLGVSTSKMGPKAVLRTIATNTDVYNLLRLHSAGHPVKIHDVICLGYQLDDGVVFVALTTFSLALNMFRSLNTVIPWCIRGTAWHTAIFMEQPVDFYFPSEHFLCRIDRRRTLTLPQLQQQVEVFLKRHLLYADKAQWNAHCDQEMEDASIVVNKLGMATQAIHDFRLMRFWPRLTEEADSTTEMMQCFCDLGHKFCFCHHCWVMQILLNRFKSYVIPHEKQTVAEVEDIPKRKAHRKPDDPAPS